jgi:hypothetical protein
LIERIKICLKELIYTNVITVEIETLDVTAAQITISIVKPVILTISGLEKKL